MLDLPRPKINSLVSVLYEQLRDDILFAQLRPGQQLRSDALRSRYHAGVSTVREALNRLRAEGLVVQEDQRGFRVAPVSLGDLRELTMTRCWVNAVAIPASLANGDAAWEEGVLLAFHRLHRPAWRGLDAPDRTMLRERHRAFHSSIYAACGSRWMIAFADTLHDNAVRYQSLAISHDGTRDVQCEHRAILDAVLARDPGAAIALLDRHFWETVERLQRAPLSETLRADA